MDNSNVILPPEGKTCLEFLVRILFIYKKLEEGWTVKKIDDNKFEFTKEVNNDSFIFNNQ